MSHQELVDRIKTVFPVITLTKDDIIYNVPEKYRSAIQKMDDQDLQTIINRLRKSLMEFDVYDSLQAIVMDHVSSEEEYENEIHQEV